MSGKVNSGRIVGGWDAIPRSIRDGAVIDMYAAFIEACGLADQFNEYARDYVPECLHRGSIIETDWSTRTQYAVCEDCGESRALDTRDKDL